MRTGSLKSLGYSPQARRDLAAIGRFIGHDNPVRARSFVDELIARAEQVAARLLSFRARDDLKLGLRSAVQKRYLIPFRNSDEEVRVVRVVHSAQDLGSLDYD